MFQKMSDDELERRIRDAELVRKEMVGGKEYTSQGNPLHPDTASDFNSRYGGSLASNTPESENPEIPQTNVSNIHIERGTPIRQSQKRSRYTTYIKDDDGTISVPQINTTTNKRNFATLAKKSIDWDGTDTSGTITGGSWSEKGVYATGRKVGMSSAYTWTNFVYLSFQLWLAIIAVVAIGIVFLIEQVVGTGVTREVFNSLLSAIGLDWDFYLVALLCYMVLIVVCYIQLFGVALQGAMLGLRPLSGFFNIATFLLCFVGYWIPLVNCLPLVNLYIFSIQVAPR